MVLLLSIVLHLTEPLPAPEPNTFICPVLCTEDDCVSYCDEGGPE